MLFGPSSLMKEADVALTNAERQRRYIARLKAATVTNGDGSGEDEIAVLRTALAQATVTNAALEARITELETTNVRLAMDNVKLRDAQAKPRLPPDEQRERTIKALRTEVRNLKTENSALLQMYDYDLALVGAMSTAARHAISRCLHPDQEPAAAERTAAMRLFNAWLADQKSAAQRRGAGATPDATRGG
jgi:hypothetical protein